MADAPQDMMLREMNSALGRELAETFLIQLDLKDILLALRMLIQNDTGAPYTEEASAIRNAVFRDVVVQFQGFFYPKSEFPLKRDDIYKAENGGHTFFQYLLDLRDAYAAHRFGSHRQCAVGVRLDENFNVLCAGEFHRLEGAPAADGLKTIGNFIKLTDDFVSAKVERLKQSLINEANRMTLEQRKSLPIAELNDVPTTHIRKTPQALRKEQIRGSTYSMQIEPLPAGRSSSENQRPNVKNSK